MLAELDAPQRVAEEELDDLLAEDVDAARQREAVTFDRLAGERRDDIVLFGAGGLGRRTLAGLRSAGLEPRAFSDNRRELWGSTIDGLEVLSPEDAVARLGSSAAFVVTIWGAGSTHRLAHSVAQLEELGCRIVLPVSWLSWRFEEKLLPFYALDLPSRLLEQKAAVRHGFELLADEQSRREYVSQVRWRLSGDPSCLAHPVPGSQYLVTDVAAALEGDVVLDCGAFDGDTLRSWIAERGASFERYLAMEPDPISRRRLESYLTTLPDAVADRVEVLAYSVGGFSGSATFSASGSLSSSLGDGDGVTVECITFDDLSEQLVATPTFVKVDIEGAELDALGGGRRFFAARQPMVAIAAYHRQDHLWRVPAAMAELCPEHSIFLRPHNEEGWDLICYAVPSERVPAAAAQHTGGGR